MKIIFKIFIQFFLILTSVNLFATTLKLSVSEKNMITGVLSANPDLKPEIKDNDTLCTLSTDWHEGLKVWKDNTLYLSSKPDYMKQDSDNIMKILSFLYVKEAKKRSLTCGVGEEAEKSVKKLEQNNYNKVSSSQKISEKSDNQLFYKACNYVNDKFFSTSETKYNTNELREFKNRGHSCSNYAIKLYKSGLLPKTNGWRIPKNINKKATNELNNLIKNINKKVTNKPSDLVPTKDNNKFLILKDLETPARNVIIYDHNNDSIIFEKNPNELIEPASFAKLMTVYIVFEKIKKKLLNLSDKFLVSQKAWQMGGARTFLNLNSKVSVKELLLGLIVQNGNDAAVTLAEGISGNEKKFTIEMNEYAKILGMKNTYFANSTGWPHASQKTTVNDLLILTKRIIKDFPTQYKIFKEKEFTYNNISQKNRNPLLQGRNKVFGADGLITGHTWKLGYGLIGSINNSNNRISIVIAGFDYSRQRSSETNRIIDYVFKKKKENKLSSEATRQNKKSVSEQKLLKKKEAAEKERNKKLAEQQKIDKKELKIAKQKIEEEKKKREELEKKLAALQKKSINKKENKYSRIVLNLPKDWKPFQNKIVPQQDQFCQLTNRFSKEMLVAIKSKNDIRINLVHQDRQESLDALLPKGKISNWIFKVMKIEQVDDGSAAIVLSLQCKSYVGSGQIHTRSTWRKKSNKEWRATIPRDDRKFRELAKLGAGDFIIGSGILLEINAFKPGQIETFYASQQIGEHPLTKDLNLEGELFLADLSYIAALN